MKRRESYTDKDKVYIYIEKDRKGRDKYHEDDSREYKHREDRYRSDAERAHWHKMCRAREDTDRKKRSTYHISSHRNTSLRDDDRASKHKDNKDARRDNNNNTNNDNYNKNIDEISEHRSRSIHHQHVSDKACIDDLSVRKRLRFESQLSPSSTAKVSSHLPPQPSPLGKLINPTFGRSQTSWNNFSNWSYLPFQHGSPFNPYIYHTVSSMHGRLRTNMSNATTPYHYTGGDEWNGQLLESNVVSVDSQYTIQKTKDWVHGPADEVWSGLMGPQVVDKEKDMDFNIPEVRKVTEISRVSMVGKDDNTLVSRAYLSKIDVSKDLTRPKLFDEITSILDLDQESSAFYECDFKILFLKEGLKDDNSNGASLFADVDDSIYKKAMSLYTKQSVCVNAVGSRSVEDHERESCEPSVADCEVKVQEFCNNDDGKVKDSRNNDDEVRDSCNDDDVVKNSCHNDNGSK